MSDTASFQSPRVTDENIRRATNLLRLPSSAFFGADGSDPRQEVLRSMETIDVAACPGSGKTTLLVAKLAILEESWPFQTRGICVLSHTNVARNEVETLLGNTTVGRRLLSYPHYIGTIHAFVNDFLALPWLRSKGYPVKMIDTDACLDRRWNALSFNTREALSKNKHDPSVLTVRSPSFEVGDIRWGKNGVLKRTTATYCEIRHVCQQSVADGVYCYDEMFVWARDLMGRVPDVVQIIRNRFPILFMDEAQDNSEDQSAILHRIFRRGASPVVRQRFGDSNQAIFNGTDGADATTDRFPGGAVISLPTSHRFGQSIANLADPLAVTPHALKGQGPKRGLDSGAADGRHTLFLFSDSDATKVLDAYGRLLVETFSEQELREGAFTAIGQVHRQRSTESPAKHPEHVAHYWRDYAPELAGRDPRPRSFTQCISAGATVAHVTGEAFAVVERIAEGILRLADLIDGKRTFAYVRHRHSRILELLRDHPQLRKAYEGMITTFAVNREVLNEDAWNSNWRNTTRAIAEAIAGCALSAAPASTFLQWSDRYTPVPGAPTQASHGNVYKYPSHGPKVLIRAGSIHSVKGETHTATLLLETFWYTHNLASLLPWLDGRKSGGASASTREKTRLKLHYVAMTRPTHLLCLAAKRTSFEDSDGTLDSKLITRFEKRGWQVKVV